MIKKKDAEVKFCAESRSHWREQYGYLLSFGKHQQADESDCCWMTKVTVSDRPKPGMHWRVVTHPIAHVRMTHKTDTIWPVVWWPHSADGGSAGAAAGLLSAAWGAAAGLRTSDAGTGLPCSGVFGWRAGSPIASHHVITSQINFGPLSAAQGFSSFESYSICSYATDKGKYCWEHLEHHFIIIWCWSWKFPKIKDSIKEYFYYHYLRYLNAL